MARRIQCVLVGIALGLTGCRGLQFHSEDKPRVTTAKAVGRAAISIPTFGLSEIGYGARAAIDRHRNE